MRNILAIALMLALSSCGSQKGVQKEQAPSQDQTQQQPPRFDNYAEGPPASADTVLIAQPDDSKLHIIGFGTMFISYTETMDGYTLILNRQGVYEYAVKGNNGDLAASGVDARDPKDRSKTDEAFLSKIPRHLRYEGPKLKDLLDRQRKWEESVKYGNQYRLYKEQQQKKQQEQQPEQKKQDSDQKK